MSDKCCAAPLLDLLESVPEDGRATYEEGEGVNLRFRMIPYGHHCHRAADEIKRLRAVINPLKPCKDCNGSGSESNMWRDKKNGCGRCNGYGWVLTGNRDNFREAIAAARRALDGEE